jgi:phage tail-like protein
MGTRRPPAHPSFRFSVDIEGINQAIFTECTLPDAAWDVLEIKEGGQNTYVHKLPGRRISGKITLKSGLGKADLISWYQKCMGEQWIRKDVTVKLLAVDKSEVISWKLSKAFPTKWSGPSLKSDDSSIAIETLELAYESLTTE